MRLTARLVTVGALALSLVGCSSSTIGAPPAIESTGTSTTIASPPSSAATTTSASSTTEARQSTTVPTTTVAVLDYVFPLIGRDVSYGRTHHDYPATDVFGCGAFYVAPVGGEVVEISIVDRWDPAVNDPATRGGLFVSIVGDDDVRYYASHLEQVLVEVGDVVAAGEPLGVVGATGNARNSACHLHFGISRPCDGPEWAVRRGEVWPWPYLDAWRNGEQKSPALEILAAVTDVPDACTFAEAWTGETSASE